MSAPVFMCAAAADAVVGSVLEMVGDEARHAITVQRRTPGEVVDLVDGSGVRARGPIVGIADGRLTVEVREVLRDADAPAVLVQALAKNGRDEQAVEAATELGATRVIPWAAERSIVQWRGPKALKARERWVSLVVAATKQSRRAFTPTVDALASTKELVELVRGAVADGSRVLVLHEDATVALVDMDWDGAGGQSVWLVVGPEGGISEREIDALRGAGAVPVVLGPHVLRASSAGPAALAALSVVRGSWSARGDARALR